MTSQVTSHVEIHWSGGKRSRDSLGTDGTSWGRTWSPTPTFTCVFCKQKGQLTKHPPLSNGCQLPVPPIGLLRGAECEREANTFSNRNPDDKPVGRQREHSLRPQLSQILIGTGMSLCLLASTSLTRLFKFSPLELQLSRLKKKCKKKKWEDELRGF